MQTKITQSDTLSALGLPSCKKMLKITSGKFLGRMIAVFKTSDNEVKYTFADAPYNNWSLPITIINDSSNSPVDLAIDSNNNVMVVYCEATTNNLASILLEFDDGSWIAQSKVYIFNNGSSFTPTINVDQDDNFHVVWSKFDIVSFDIQYKSSADGGLTWGSGPADSGVQLNTGLSSAFPKIVTSNNKLYCVYNKDFTTISIQERSLSGGSWSSEYIVATGSNIDEHFDLAVLPDGFLGVAFDADGLYYREFNGVNWETALLLEQNPVKYPQVVIVDNFPVILYLIETDPEQFTAKYIHRQTGSFSTGVEVDPRVGAFDKVLLFDKTSETYADLTSMALSNGTADIYHPSSLLLMSEVEDKIYLGSENKFKYARIILSTTGAGGAVNFSYYDGSNWRSFTPFNGGYNFDQTDKKLSLWEDFDSVPENWQKSFINDDLKYWVKIEVVTSFTTPPVGSQLTSFPNLKGLSVRR